MRLTNIQKNKVEEIISLYNNNIQNIVEFKSPTGSGKTIMATNVISELIVRNPQEKFIFIIATISSSELPKSFKEKIDRYKSGLSYSNFEVEHIESPSTNVGDKTESTIRLLPEKNKVYIFGKSTFGSKRIFTERGIIDDFLQISKDQGYKIIYIRDEAHIGTTTGGPTKRDITKFEDLMLSYSDFIIKMTATLDFNNNSKKVVLTEKELNDPLLNEGKWLLKTTPISLLNSNIEDKELLNNGINEFKKIKEQYSKLENERVFIRPALLIQVDNDSSKLSESKIFEENLTKIKDTLTYHGLSWVQYFGSTNIDSNIIGQENIKLNELTDNNSEIDVIIFKIGPATGWDIPRANMLIQLRNVTSLSLNTQTVGRIKRNPYPNLEKNSITDKFYVYSNIKTNKTDLNVFKYKVRDQFANDEFAVIRISNSSEVLNQFKKINITYDFIEFLSDQKNKIIQTIKYYFKVDRNNFLFYNKILSNINNNLIYRKIKNPFLYLKEYNFIIAANHREYSKVKEAIKISYETIFKDILLYENMKINIEQLTHIVLMEYKETIRNLINSNTNVIPKYEVKLEQYNPRDYIEIKYEEIKNKSTPGDLNKYLMEIFKNGEVDNVQPLDSMPEVIVFKKLRNLVETEDSNIKIWSRNFVNSNINAEYFDEFRTLRKSYFDFVIKFNNGLYWYIEVKSKKDIDINKTKILRDAYSDYFKDRNYNLFDVPIILSLCIVNTENNKLEVESFYDKTLLDFDLNTSIFDEIMKKISLQ